MSEGLGKDVSYHVGSISLMFTLVFVLISCCGNSNTLALFCMLMHKPKVFDQNAKSGLVMNGLVQVFASYLFARCGNVAMESDCFKCDAFDNAVEPML